MKRLSLIVLAACMTAVLNAGTVNYTADNITIFPNPERGFLRQTTRHANQKDAVQSRIYELNNLAAENGTLVLVLYYLDEFIAEPTLPDSILEAFDVDMDTLRNRGMKAIVRIAYAEHSYGEGSSRSAHDAPLSIIEHHLDQFKSLWAKNTDVIYTFQAGFVGQYGEWYYTDNFENHVPSINANCRALLDTVLKAIPQDRTLLLRRPMFKQQYCDGVALTAGEAYTGTAKSRLGHFNDAFLYDYDNMGTYSSKADTAIQKPFIAQETLYVPLGGETDITDIDKANQWASYDSTIAEMSRMHWTFIKSTYAETTTNKWRADGTFDELNRRLGYRFQLVSGTYSNEVTAGEDLSVSLQIRNAGFAPLYNARTAYIVLKNGNTVYKLPLASDPRTWLPNGAVANINEQLAVPSDAINGTYSLYLYLPDAYESIANDSRYAIRFANTGVWDSETGMNDLGASVVINSAVEPEPETSILLPATLNKANVTAYSDDMTWYSEDEDYFDFGPTDASNLNRWAEWRVELRYPGQYTVSEDMHSVLVKDPGGDWWLGHSWQLALLRAEGDTVSSYTTEGKWKDGEIVYSQKWDLSAVAKGTYTLRVRNALKNAQPKLKRITLDYVGDLPTALPETESATKAVKMLRDGQLLIEYNGTTYNVLGIKQR